MAGVNVNNTSPNESFENEFCFIRIGCVFRGFVLEKLFKQKPIKVQIIFGR